MRLSHSSLSIFRDCPRCFWMEKVKGVKRPEGIKATLMNGIDSVLKDFAESVIQRGAQHPLFNGSLTGATLYPDRLRLKKWQHWASGPQVEINEDGITATLIGAVDEAAWWPSILRASPLDYKSRGKPPVPGDSEKYYGPQLDSYHCLIEEGAKVSCTGKGHLIYVWPSIVDTDGCTIKFNTTIHELYTDPGRTHKLVVAAAKCLMGPEPAIGSKEYKGKIQPCEYCVFFESRSLNKLNGLNPGEPINDEGVPVGQPELSGIAPSVEKPKRTGRKK